MLKVTTSHLKEGWLRRNGVPRSEKATLIEYFIRHGNYLTLVTRSPLVALPMRTIPRRAR